MSNKANKRSGNRVMWSATPTPFTGTMEIDAVAVERLVNHHIRLGVDGLFVGGSCGEGPWLTDGQRRDMIRRTAECADGRLSVAAQVTDNSAARILDNIETARDAGADIAVIAPPLFAMNATGENLIELYREAIRKSPLPVGMYDRGAHSSVELPVSVLEAIYAEDNVVLVKDSSTDADHMEVALQARRRRPDLKLLNGDEFHCVKYLTAGYDGLLLGGGIFNGMIARMLIEAVEQGDLDAAEALQERMNRLMWDVYGGKSISCWLAGLKHLLVRMNVFRTTLNYPRYTLSASCEAAIEQALERERDVLLPERDEAGS